MRAIVLEYSTVKYRKTYRKHEGPNMKTQQQAFGKIIPSLILIMMIVMFASISRTILSPVLIEVEREFQMSHGPASCLFLYMSIGFSGSILFSGYVSSRFTHRGTILISSLLLSFALVLTAAAARPLWLTIGVVLIGIGSGLYPSSGLTVLHSLVIPADRQKAISIHEIGPHLAMLIAPLLANLFIQTASWRAAYAALSVMTLAAGIFFYVRIQTGSFRGQAPSFSHAADLFRNRKFLTVMLFFILALSSLQGIYAVVPVFLVSEGGMSQGTVNFFFSLSRIIPVTALLFAGTLQDRIGLKRSLQVSLFGAGLCVLLMGLLHGTPLLLSVFLQPALGAALLLAVIGTIGNISSEADCSVTFSMMAPAAGLIGTGAVPAFIGFMGDAFTFSSAFIMVGALMLACCLLTVKLTLD